MTVTKEQTQLRILLLHSRPLNFATAVGGLPEFLKAITFEFKTMGLDVLIYAGDKSSSHIQHTSYVHDTIKVINGPLLQPQYWVSSKKLRLLTDFCQDQQITVMHAQGTYTPGFMVREIAKVTQIPYVITSHSDIHPKNSMRLKRANVRKRCYRILRDAAWITHLSPTMQQASDQLYDSHGKSSLIHNGIHIENRKSCAPISEKKYLLSIGRLVREKGFHVLIEMYAELLKRGVTSALVIAGAGDYEHPLRQQCTQLGLKTLTGLNKVDEIPEKCVVFTGYVRGELKQQLLNHCQFVLFATQPDTCEEAFGLVQLEAMAASKALIASDIAAARYLQNLGMQAIIVPPSHIPTWVTAAEQLLKNPEQRLTMGTANTVLAEQFNWRTIAKQYYAVYQRVVG